MSSFIFTEEINKPTSVAKEDDITNVLDLASKGEYQKAIEDSQNILTKNNDNFEVRFILGNLYLETGQYQKAEEILEFFSTLTPSVISQLKADKLLLLSQGTWLYAVRKGDKNLFHKVVGEYLPQIEKLQPENPALYTFWGNCYLEKGDVPASEECFKDALKLDSQDVEAYLGLATIHLISDTIKAIPFINQVLSLTNNAPNIPSSNSVVFAPRAEAFNLLATVQLINEQFSNAISSVNNALAINPNSISYRATKASIYYLNNNIQEFEKECKEVLSVNLKPAVFYLIIGNNCERRLFYPEAQAFYEKALAYDEHLWDAQIATGFNYLHLGPEYEDKGRKLLTDAFERDPFNVKAYNILKVLDALNNEFEVVKTKHFEIKLHKSERFLLEPYITELLETAYDKFVSLYQYKPTIPLLVEVFPNHNDFSVRLMGFPGFIGALGVCFVKTFLVLSPKAQEQMAERFHWGAITVHEFMHIITLQMSKFRVPRWFTEGCSVYAEKLFNPIWGEEIEDEIYQAMAKNKLQRLTTFIDRRDADILHSYHLSSIIIEYIKNVYGMEKIVKMLNSWGECKNTETVFKECLGKSVSEFDDEFFNYLKNEFFKDINPKAFEDSFKKAKEFLKRNKIPEATAEFIKAKQYFPRYTKAGDSPYHYLISIYEEQGETDKMFQEIEELVKMNQHDFPNRLKLAKRYRSLKQYDKLVDLLKESVYLEPESIQLHDCLAEGYRFLKDYTSALREYEISIKLLWRLVASKKRNAALADFYCLSAEIYLELNDKSKAKDFLTKAQEVFRDYKRIGELLKRCK
jgi:tetratricopeptide (TPR) repeat protein